MRVVRITVACHEQGCGTVQVAHASTFATTSRHTVGMPSAPESVRHRTSAAGALCVVTDDLDFATLDLDDESPGSTARVNGWLDAIMRGFHQSQPNDGFREKWLAAVRADEAVNRGAWATPVAGLSNEVPVATFGHFVKTINAGAAAVPAWMITDVTVAPTHRRRGLMRRLMTDNLDSAVAAGVPVAVLTASEGAIYQRFGFGPATREARVRVDTSSRFRLRERADDGGQVAIVAPGEAWPLVEKVFARHHELTRGSVGRPSYYESWHKGYDWDEHERGPQAAHRGAFRRERCTGRLRRLRHQEAGRRG